MRRVFFLALLLSSGCGPSCHENERHASAALKTLTVANVDFRSNDRDGNKINDFWTGDVASLYHLKPPGTDEPIKLIAPEVAAADPSRPGAKPYHGYWFIAMEKDETGEPYRQYGLGKGDKSTYHTAKFGFCAYPAEPGVTGKAVFIVNEGNTIFKRTKKLEPILQFPSDDGEDDVPPPPPLPLLEIADADAGLKRTSVAPVLQIPHVDGTNLIWCATFQMAWDEMADHIRAKAPTLVGGPAYVADLNASRGGKKLVKDEWVVACAGKAHDTARSIHALMNAKFPGVPVPPEVDELAPGADCIAFAYLRRILPFRSHFERYPEAFKFGGRDVSAFGVRPHGPRRGAADQVTVHSYSGPADFTVEIATSSEDDRLIIARLPRKDDLLGTVRAALARIDSGTKQSVESQDDFRVPCFNFDVHKRFRELENREFGPDSGIGEKLYKALQVNQFLLGESGVKLVSYSKLDYSVVNGDYQQPLPAKRLVCDGPFLFMLLMKGAPLPYFVIWVENPELLCPR